ncbi:MAG: CPBP family intramembrane metalloprotease [Clostridiales bacterium]|nr:CPBP family intramembrane metalloprotease [Clostridiales bacterium]
MLKNSKNLSAYDYGDACTFYLGAIIVTLISQAVAGIVASALSGAVPDIASNGDFNTAFMIVIQLANAAFIYFYTKIKRKKFDFTFVRRDGDGKGITPAVIIVPIVAAVVLMVGMYLPTVWYGYFTRVIGVPKSAGEIELSSVSSIVMIIIASVALAPCMEETIYRGVLLHGMRREKTEVKAVMFSALAFTIMHMNVVQVVFQFALGVLSGFVALKSKRLLPSVILHATANGLALLIQLPAIAAWLLSCELWLTGHVAAAVFITLGLFVAAGGALYFIVKYAFGRAPEEAERQTVAEVEPAAKEIEEAAQEGETDDEKANKVVEVRKAAGRSDGTFKYFIGIGICAVMLIVNLVTVIVS